jgi:hypothetical protein
LISQERLNMSIVHLGLSGIIRNLRLIADIESLEIDKNYL